MRKIYLATIAIAMLLLCSPNSLQAQVNENPQINELKEPIEGLRIYPNPVVGNKLYITSTQGKTKIITIFNVLGDRVLYDVMLMNVNELNIASLSAGVYVVQITEDKKTATRKLVIR